MDEEGVIAHAKLLEYELPNVLKGIGVIRSCFNGVPC